MTVRWLKVLLPIVLLAIWHSCPSATMGDSPLTYVAQSGDTLEAVAARFRVKAEHITSTQPIPQDGLLPPGLLLYLPLGAQDVSLAPWLLPDSEVIYSPSALNFDVAAYLNETEGYLKTHDEYLRSSGQTSAAEIIARIALENSISPRLLLALLEYRCHCVLGFPDENIEGDNLLKIDIPGKVGLYRQLGWAISRLSLGYYGWRTGLFTELVFTDGVAQRIPPNLNPGSVALEFLFAQLYDHQAWQRAVDLEEGFPALYRRMFGDPWQRALKVEPLFSADLRQPPLILPFEPGKVWSFTSGPHKAWETDGAVAALDFAPASMESGCLPSPAWVVAMADGVVARSEYGAVVLDLDDPSGLPGDGNEQSGWAILYMHVDRRERAPLGVHLQAGERIGHPSCEGGPASGTHIHIARKYNGEWIAADGPLPFVMDSWVAHSGSRPYRGSLNKDGKAIVANWFSPNTSFIVRLEEVAHPSLVDPYRHTRCCIPYE